MVHPPPSFTIVFDKILWELFEIKNKKDNHQHSSSTDVVGWRSLERDWRTPKQRIEDEIIHQQNIIKRFEQFKEEFFSSPSPIEKIQSEIQNLQKKLDQITNTIFTTH